MGAGREGARGEDCQSPHRDTAKGQAPKLHKLRIMGDFCCIFSYPCWKVSFSAPLQTHSPLIYTLLCVLEADL